MLLIHYIRGNEKEVIKLVRTNIKYYLVTAKCGHVGRKKYIPITFGVKAASKKLAALRTKEIPRVKRDKKDAILEVTEVGYNEFMQVISINNKDRYLSAKNIQQQRQFFDEIVNRIVSEGKIEEVKRSKKERKEFVKYIQKKQRIQHNHFMEEINDYLLG